MAEITLKGEVGVDITLWQIVAEVQNIPINEPITFRITSEGGSAVEGRNIYYLNDIGIDWTSIPWRLGMPQPSIKP
jgi:ATP-dependent protease ClpP protease subunit